VGDVDDHEPIGDVSLVCELGNAFSDVDHLVPRGGVDGFVDDGLVTHRVRTLRNHFSG
jgi:hypothetical protein